MRTLCVGVALFFSLAGSPAWANNPMASMAQLSSNPVARYLMLNTAEGQHILTKTVLNGVAPTHYSPNLLTQYFNLPARARGLEPELITRLNRGVELYTRSGLPAVSHFEGAVDLRTLPEYARLFMKEYARAFLRMNSAGESFVTNAVSLAEAEQTLAMSSEELASLPCMSRLMPLRRFAVPEARSGDLNMRIQEFVARYPENATLVSGAVFQMPQFIPMIGGADSNRTPETLDVPARTERDLVLLSLEGLTEDQVNAISTDWLQSTSNGSLSYPMGPGGGTLYRRVAGNTFSYWNSNNGAYRATGSGSERIEAVIRLNPIEEYEWLAFHEMGIDGGYIKMNLHGRKDACTSPGLYWHMAESNRPFFMIQGHLESEDTSDNPSWVQRATLARAAPDRIPAVLIASRTRSLNRLRDDYPPGQVVNWNFGTWGI